MVSSCCLALSSLCFFCISFIRGCICCMLRFERNDFIVRGTVSNLISKVNIMIASAGTCTTESMATRTLSCVCHIAFQIPPKSSPKLFLHVGSYELCITKLSVQKPVRVQGRTHLYSRGCSARCAKRPLRRL